MPPSTDSFVKYNIPFTLLGNFYFIFLRQKPQHYREDSFIFSDTASRQPTNPGKGGAIHAGNFLQ